MLWYQRMPACWSTGQKLFDNMAAEMLDRVNGPGVEWGETFVVPTFDQRVLPNGLPVWMLPEEEEGVVSLRLLFAVDGRWGITPAVAHGTMELMPRGAGAKSEQAIFEALDGWGSQVAFSYRLDYGMVWVRTLRQNFTDTIMLLREVLTQPAYAAESLSAWQNSEEAALRVSLQQPDTLAMRAQLDALYPRGHRYAAFSQQGDYQRVDTQALHRAHGQWIGAANCKAIYVGSYDAVLYQGLCEALGNATWGEAKAAGQGGYISPKATGEREPLRQSASAMKNQASIRMGLLLPKLPLEELWGITFAVNLLGGYFGSRLMTNLRERNGYTYGVSAQVHQLLEATRVGIGTEVGNDCLLPAIREIAHELATLQDTLPSHDELEALKAYLIGGRLRSFDGPFQSAQTLQQLVENRELPVDYFVGQMRFIRNITPERVQEAARKWLNSKDFTLSVGGDDRVIRQANWPLV